MKDAPKRQSLLSVYERHTQKETLCLKEGDVPTALATQAKKAKLLSEIKRLDESEPLFGDDRRAFREKVEALLRVEKENEALLETLMQANRAEYQKSATKAKSAAGVKRAYGTASRTGSLTPLKRKA